MPKQTKLVARTPDDPMFQNPLPPPGAARRLTNDEWLALYHEDALEPDLPIVNSHHHFYDRGGLNFDFDKLLSDINTGHNIRATVYIDCGSMYRQNGPEHMKVVGEVEYANGMAAMSASGQYGPSRICAAIVSSADVTLGDEVEEVLDAQIAVAKERFRGIRVSTRWDPHPALNTGRFIIPKGIMLDSDFRAGFAKLAPRNLSFDASLAHHQLPELTDLARAFSGTTIIVNHMGGLLASTKEYKARQQEEETRWKAALKDLATCPNIYMKLGGLGGSYLGYGFDKLEKPASSAVLAEAWKQYILPCIDMFGPERCMFESNFPPDRSSAGYPVIWNTFKRITKGFTAAERNAMFFSTAVNAYQIKLD